MIGKCAVTMYSTDPKMRDFKEKAIYRHYKGNHYVTLYLAKDSETKEDMVVYRNLTNNEVYIRPLSMFMDELDKDKYPDAKQQYRFEYVARYHLCKSSIL